MTAQPVMRVWLLLAASLWCSPPFADDVTVSAEGSVGIGVMEDGVINLGLTPQEAEALAQASGEVVLEQLAPILERINAEIRTTNQQENISIGVAQMFLTVIRGKQVPLAEWPDVFSSLIVQYQQLGRQIDNTPVTSDAIEQLVAQADEARQQGKLELTDQLLIEATELATKDMEHLEGEIQRSRQQLASLNASRATLAMTQLERTQGATLFEAAFELRRDDASNETIWWLFKAGDAWMTAGRSADALRVYQTALEVTLVASSDTPDDTQWQRDLSISYNRIGNVQAAQGNTAAALESYQAGLAIAERLTADDSHNTEWQRDLSISVSAHFRPLLIGRWDRCVAAV